MGLPLKITILSILIYIIAVILLFRFDPTGHFNFGNSVTVTLTIFGALVLGMLLFLGFKKDIMYGFKGSNLSWKNLWNITKLFLMVLLGLGIFLGFVTLIFKFMKNPPASKSVYTILNTLIFITTLAFFLYFIKDVETGNPYINLIKNFVLYLPCLLYDAIDWAKEQYRITTPTAFIILGIDILFIVLEKTWSKIKQLYNHRGTGKILLKGPIYLDTKNVIGSYEDIKPTINNINYSYYYGISFWIYINPQPPNTSISYNSYSTLFSYGDKPSLLYKADENKLKIQVKLNNEELRDIYLGNDLKLQKWNHFIINYDGGTLDVILNNKLISSSSSIAPYMTLDAVTVGQTNGIHGAIKDVEYFRKPLI